MTQHTLAAVAAGLLMITTQSVFANDNISFNYDAIYDKMRDMQAQLQSLSDIQPVLKISSSSCGVKLSEVTIELQSNHTAPAKLAVDKLGQVSFPVEPKLYKNGYSVVSNQQHGLRYGVKMRLMVNTTDVSFKELAQLETDFRQGLRTVGGFIAYHVMIPQGLVFIYADGSPSMVISSPKGNQTISARPAGGYHGLPDGTSIIKLPLDPESNGLNGKISLQRLPDSIDVMFAPDIEQAVAEQDAREAKDCKPN